MAVYNVWCKLDNGMIGRYHMALKIDSKAHVSNQFKFIGIGVVIEVDDIPFNNNTKLRFYKVKKKLKHHNRR